MKYHSQLIEATLLKRPISFLMEVVLQSRRRIMLRCPNLGPLNGCDILGTQLWFSAPSNGHCLPTLELVEVNGGFLVGVNPEILNNLFIDAIKQSYIKELPADQIIFLEANEPELDGLNIVSMHNEFSGYTHVCLEHIIHADDRLEALFPVSHQSISIDYLLSKKQQGHRSILMFCILHSGAKSLKMVNSKNPLHLDKIKLAIKQGVEVLAYKAQISTQKIELINKVPIISQVIANLD